ncbi:DUF935 domain-containing protein [Amorphus coralli]|uniref:DUF935 domain-containing protein n=1 Tax=Amorphus coralli TaxID=340680 RepID=UPI00036E22F0|nr:DUF935 domain-containing protein [Amorphus coralli]
MAQLLDQYGQPIKKRELGKPVAGPTLGGVRPVISGHPAEGLTPRRLARIHKAAAEGDPLAYFELAEDIEERDLHYLGVLSTRKRSVAQLPMTVTPASDDAEHKKHAELVQSWINDEILAAALFDMLDAIGKGFSVMEIDWRYHMGHLCPRELIYRPQRWFMFDRDDGETVLLREGVAGEPLQPHLFAVHRHRSKSGLTVRSGLARVASWAWMYKSFTLKDWAIFTQNFGMPIRIGKFGPNASEEEKDVLWRAVSNIAGDCAAIIPASMVIEFEEVDAKTSSSELYEKRADWMDRQVSKAVLGQTTTTDAISGGHAVSQEHRLVQEDIERSDAAIVSATVNSQIVPNLVAFNFGPQDRYPKVRIGRPDEVPLEQFATAFDKVAKHGVTAPLSYMRGRLGIPEPKEGDELVGGRRAVSIPPGDPGDEPETKPSTNAARRLLASRMAREDQDALVDRMTRRLEEETAGVMAGLAGEIRAVLEEATDMADAARRLARMNLSADALADALARGMALAEITGRASLIDDLQGRE